MNYSQWQELSPARQVKLCQQLNPYEDWDLFKSVERAFRRSHGRAPGIAKVFCGILGTLGSLNGISVRIKRGKSRTQLPKTFMGFPVIRSYTSKSHAA